MKKLYFSSCYKTFSSAKIQRLLTLTLIFLASAAFAQDQLTIKKVVEQKQKCPQELVYLHTDREVYAPGDTIWFKAYIREKSTLTPKTASSTFNLKLVNDKGIVLYDTKHLVFDSESIGQMKIDDDFTEGIYTLVAYSSWMKNYTFEDVFQKTIQIKNNTDLKARFSIKLNSRFYLPEDTITTTVRFFDKDNQEIIDADLRYRLLINNVEISDVEYKSELLSLVKLPIPSEVPQQLQLRVSTVYKGFLYDSIVNIPVYNHVNIGFYPEGGNFIAGITNRIAFQAAGAAGVMDVEGEIYNSNNEKLLDVKTEHDGMGMFLLNPAEDEAYYLKVTKPQGVKGVFKLPEIEEKGWVLQANQNNGILNLTAINNFEKERSALITLSMRGNYMSFIKDTLGNYFSKNISTSTMPVGIGVVTLYNSEFIPCAERLVFLNYDRLYPLKLQTKYKEYLPRDLTELKLDFGSMEESISKGSYSLAVVDQELTMNHYIDEGNMLSNYLISSEIKGALKNPSYYFSEISDERKHHLDLLLLTQGWRRYSSETFDAVLTQSTPEPVLQDIISGTLVSNRYGRKPKPVAGEITIYNSGGTGKLSTDKSGHFEFLHHWDTVRDPNISLFGHDLTGSAKVSVLLDEDKFEKGITAYLAENADTLLESQVYLPDSEVGFEDRYSLGVNNQWLQEVAIYSKSRQKIIRLEKSFSTANTAPKDVILGSADIYDILLNMGLPVQMNEGNAEQMKYIEYMGHEGGIVNFFWNDFPRSYSDVEFISPAEIDDIIVLKHPDTQFYLDADEGMIGTASGVVALVFTKSLVDANSQKSRKNMVILQRFEHAKEFYKPLYNTEAMRHSSIPDLRKTIHWESKLKINADGTASVKFYNGDRYTKVKCIIEGITQEGIPVYGEYDYDVSLSKSVAK